MQNKINLSEGAGVEGRFLLTLRDLDGNIIERQEIKNLVTNVAKNMIAARLNNETGDTGVINYLAIGTGTNTPAATDTTLQTEVYRKTILSQSRTNSVTTLEWYFGPTEGNGALKEVGAFIDGTASANTGQLFDRAAIDIVKTTLNSLTVSLIITVS